MVLSVLPTVGLPSQGPAPPKYIRGFFFGLTARVASGAGLHGLPLRNTQPIGMDRRLSELARRGPASKEGTMRKRVILRAAGTSRKPLPSFSIGQHPMNALTGIVDGGKLRGSPNPCFGSPMGNDE